MSEYLETYHRNERILWGHGLSDENANLMTWVKCDWLVRSDYRSPWFMSVNLPKAKEYLKDFWEDSYRGGWDSVEYVTALAYIYDWSNTSRQLTMKEVIHARCSWY